MKKAFSLLLAAAMLLSLCACGKTPTLADLMDYPMGSSLKECGSFVKKCGYEIENTTDKYVSFTDGTWDGLATVSGLSLKYNTFGISDEAFQKAVADVRSEVVALCGEPYASHAGTQMTPMSTEFYLFGDMVLTITVMSGVISSLSVDILPRPAA